MKTKQEIAKEFEATLDAAFAEHDAKMTDEERERDAPYKRCQELLDQKHGK